MGVEPVKALFERAAVPLAGPGTKGAWLARQRLMAIDATSFDVADTEVNAARFGRMGSGPKASAYPKLYVAALAECGSHAIVGAVLGGCRTGERSLAAGLAASVGPDMLVTADAGLSNCSAGSPPPAPTWPGGSERRCRWGTCGGFPTAPTWR